MTPADERILKMIEKWRASLELHAGYSRLGDDQYWLVQPWPKHQRPTAWVVQLAQQRLADLDRIVKTRIAAGDTSLSEALELMSFLANLVGAQNVERFVPMAEPEQERPIHELRAATAATGTVEMPAPRPPASAETTGEMPVARGARNPDATGEMPAPRTPASPESTAEMPAPARADTTREMPALPRADATREMPALPAAARPEAPREKRGARRRTVEPKESPPPRDERDLEVVRDAVRLLGWGREWHELPEAIARMAGRPDKTRIRGILQSHRAVIERQARAAARAH
jgi:hypothetical protein